MSTTTLKSVQDASAVNSMSSKSQDLTGMQALTSEERRIAHGILFKPDYDCMLDSRFREAKAEKTFWLESPVLPAPDVSWYVPMMEKIEDSAQANPSPSLLTTAQEKQLFLRFNYCRYRVLEARAKALRGVMTVARVREVLLWHQRAQQCQEHLARANLALVLAMIKRMHLVDVDFSDLISEGNIALLRAIDKFDVNRGFKFSTYACRVIIKAFSRFTKKLSRRRQLFPASFEPDMERSDHADRVHQEVEEQYVDELKQILRDNRAELSDVEQQVIRHRFAVACAVTPTTKSPQRPMTLIEVGKLIGLTKERVRQIQNQAMDKIRQTLNQQCLT